MNTDRQQIVLQSLGGEKARCPEYPGKTAQILGLIRVTAGVMCVLLQAVALGKTLNTDFSGDEEMQQFVVAGFPCGVFYVIAGAVGYAAGWMKTLRLIVANKVLSIISASICGPLMLINNGFAIDYTYGLLDLTYSPGTGLLAVFVLLLVVGVIVLICDVTTAIIACRAVGCSQCCCGLETSHLPDEPILASTPEGIQVVLVTKDRLS